MAGTSFFESVGTRVPVLDAAAALSTARDQRDQLAVGASERDSQRILPARELETLSRSGLLGITVPAAYGGADLPTEVVAEVFALLAAGDPSVAQIPHSHFVYVNVLRHQGTPAQQAFFFGEVLAGRRFGNAQSEVGTKTVRDHRTTLTRRGDGQGWLLTGEKGYSTGALFADWIPVLTHLGPDGPMHVRLGGAHGGRSQRRRRLGRHGPADDRERHRAAGRRRGRRLADHALRASPSRDRRPSVRSHRSCMPRSTPVSPVPPWTRPPSS